MRMPRPAPRLTALGLLAVAVALGGCNEIIPKFELRDDYMGKRFLQPGKVTGEVERGYLSGVGPDASTGGY